MKDKKRKIIKRVFPVDAVLTRKTPMDVLYPGVLCYEGCGFAGYYDRGDSFVFTQSFLTKKEEEKQVLLCLSRGFLEQLLRDYKKEKNEK